MDRIPKEQQEKIVADAAKNFDKLLHGTVPSTGVDVGAKGFFNNPSVRALRSLVIEGARWWLADGPAKRSLACLSALYLWDSADARTTREYADRYEPWPIPAEGQAIFAPQDVSLVVPTVDWDVDLSTNLLSWLQCRPREVIFVTTDRLVNNLINDFEAAPGLKDAVMKYQINIRVVSVQRANKRSQLCRGINEATGKIVALVDDDARWTSEEVLTTLLAPFQNADVSLVGGPIESYVPPERRRPDVITGWEVAALRTRSRRRLGNKAFYVRDSSTNFTVSGLTMLLRTEIVQDPYFQHLFTHDMFQGVRQNTGDDGFITRYVLFRHLLPHLEYSKFPIPRPWRLGMQFDRRATVQTSLLTDSRFVDQSKRWFRSGLRLRLTCLFYEPGFFKFRRAAPYMHSKMMGGLLGPLLVYYRLYLWCVVWYSFPQIAFGLFLYVLYNYLSSLLSFYREFPYVGKKIYAAVLADHAYLFTDIYSWFTLSLESWSNRTSVGEGDFGEIEAEDEPLQREAPTAPQAPTAPNQDPVSQATVSEIPTSQAPIPSKTPTSQAPVTSKAPTSQISVKSTYPDTSASQTPASDISTSQAPVTSEIPTSEDPVPSKAPTSQVAKKQPAPVSHIPTSEIPTSEDYVTSQAPTYQIPAPKSQVPTFKAPATTSQTSTTWVPGSKEPTSFGLKPGESLYDVFVPKSK